MRLLTEEELEQARADYRRVHETLMGHRRAAELREKQALVGKYFKHIHVEVTDRWPVYLAVTSLDLENEHLSGWVFQCSSSGLIEITGDENLEPGFLVEQCIEIPRGEFVVAFNELLTTVAAFTHRMPV